MSDIHDGSTLTDDVEQRRPPLGWSLVPLAAMLVLLAVGYGALGLAPEPLLILSAIIAGLVALRMGLTWEEMLLGIREKLDTAMPALLVLISIGILIGTWMIAGTIPMMIYYGLGLISAQFIVLIAFVISAIVSVITGTSWGSAGTVGVALMGIATGLDAPLAATAGAIVAGAYFGDKLSPLSDTTNLAPIAAGTTLWEHIRHMLYTTIPATIVALAIYLFVGVNQSSGGTDSERIDAVTGTLSSLFDFNVLLLLPMLIILGGAILKLPTLPTIIGSSLAAGILAAIFQKVSVESIFASTVDGFTPDMLEVGQETIDGLDPDVTELVTQGGMASMTGVILIAFSAFAFAGIMSKSGALETIIRSLLKFVKRTGDLVLSTVLSCITMAVVTGNSYLSIIVPGELFKKAYADRGLDAKNLSRTLEDSGTVVVPLVPWSSAGVYMAGVLGVSVLDYAPWAVFCYVGFAFAIILGYTGIGIVKRR
ncbi:MAG: Na+/H+ antiporter NhaC [Brevibacterium sp.]|uniref:Na+/H+ antiporter NhaC n=1 Tax=Brevibacterium sp. TaxID=1701 RepID=UPI0026495E1F|nr:Na+/H+ antiporter NhaC [Brevibacterium sp.]MDN5805812.1 Na+/H+ antiporter NhaC [Brevibacterium sp.]MDN5834113.1 Na+/H+ antiporter NhaC [Brevibacterium sp.]MDN5876781.1 Na+/H+ antiporter NhaC [Brevibacterium sp.]MDN6134735.1 Na+/H+ antiporter NhaC [Brevibacterium sp.]MDN6189772.1 Na+/H+ antiporter NhaC [Brevibacterium sp.]